MTVFRIKFVSGACHYQKSKTKCVVDDECVLDVDCLHVLQRAREAGPESLKPAADA